MSYFDWRGNKQGKSIFDTKIPVVICLLLPVVAILCLLLCGCVYSKLTVIEINGDDVKMPASYLSARGKNVKGRITRYVYWTNEKGREVPAFCQMKELKDENN